MSYIVLARKWRPQQFDDVVGQAHVARTLTNAISAGRLAQAYLFCGPRGVGKTTMARILAKALNCQAAEGPTPTPCQQCEPCREITQGNSVDVMEIDGASNRGINEIRELRENIRYAPLKGRRRVFIIDEVHMLTNEAFNALLKTLEEPPPHVVFVFATTEAHKVPGTIQSRCQQFTFRRLTRREISDRLAVIAGREGFTVSPATLGIIAQAADGSLRDALSLLDQAVAYGGAAISEADLRQLLGVIDRSAVSSLLEAVARRDGGAGLEVLRTVVAQGQDLRQFCGLLLEWLRHVTVIKLSTPSTGADDLVDLGPDEQAVATKLASRFTPEELQRLFLLWGRVLEEQRGGLDPVISMEMGIVRSTQLPALESFGTLLDRVAQLEQRLGTPSNAGHGQQLGHETGRKPDAVSVPQAAPPAAQETRMAPGQESPLPPSPAAGSSTDNDGWPDVVEMIRHEKPNLATYLEGALSVEIQPKELVLGYPEVSAFMVNMIKKASNLQHLEAAAARRFGRPLRIKFVVIAGADLKAARAMPAAPAASGGAPALEPLVDKALGLFGGSVVSPPPSSGGRARSSAKERT